ncbi:MAG TPA: hypothetical protein VK636_17740 [Gemmatimonadaceae bacterium]|nr:hypothetical protein [Gemmatimonadaceae bacterium]
MYSSGVSRPLWFRALIAIWGLWFTAALSEVGGIHTCPIHGGTAAHVSHSAAAHESQHAPHHGAMASAEHHAQAASPSSQPADDHHGGACTCLGLCCCGTPVASPTSTTSIVDVALVETSAPDYADLPTPSVERNHVQPFANGPPARA